MIILADPDTRFQARVSDHIARSKDDLVVVDGTGQLQRMLRDKAGVVNVVVLGPNIDTDEAFEFARKVEATYQEVSVILIAHSLTAEILQTALRSGVRDVLPAAFTGAQLVEAVGRAEGRANQIRGAQAEAAPAGGAPRPSSAAPSNHKVITVFSSKGGCGKTFVASNLAVALAMKTGESVAVVDLDLQFGDLAIMLQLFPARTIFDTVQNLERLDRDALRGYLTPYRSHVFLLAAPLEPGLSETISADAVAKIIRLLKESFPYTVIDSPPSFTDHVLAALDESEECVLITSMDVPSIKNMKLSLQTLQLLGFGRDRIRLVLNRADSKVGLTVQAVEKTLGTTVDVSIPSSRDVSVSINRGSPLVIDNPKSPVVSSIHKLLEIVAGVAAVGAGAPAPADPAEPKSWFRLRRAKSAGRSS